MNQEEAANVERKPPGVVAAQWARAPQIIAAALGGMVLKCVGGVQANMLVVAGVLLLLGAASVALVGEKKHTVD